MKQGNEKRRLRRGKNRADAAKNNTGRPAFRMIVLAVIGLACLAFCWYEWTYLSLHRTYSIESTSECTFGQDDRTIVIDNAKRTILVLDASEELVACYNGDSDLEDFFYACYAAQTEDGSLFIADIKCGDRGNLVDRERIIRIHGLQAETLFEVDYTQWDERETPLQYGRIMELQADGNDVYFLLDTGDTVALKRIGPDGTVEDLAEVPAGGVKNSASYDVETGQLIVVMRNGRMQLFDLRTGTDRTLEDHTERMPYDAAIRNGEVFYTALLEKTVRHFPTSDDSADEVFAALEDIPFKLDVSPDGQNVLVTNQVGFYRLTGSPEHICTGQSYTESVRVAVFTRVIVTWAVFSVGVVCLSYLVFKLILAIGRTVISSESALRVLLIIAASLIVSFVLAYSLLNQLLESGTDASEKQIALFSDLISTEIDTAALQTLDSPSDYGSDEFVSLKKKLDAHTWDSYAKGDNFYYAIYRQIGGNVVMVMDFEDTQPCARPQYIDDPEDNIYSLVMHTGEVIQTTEISAYGAWSFQITPIYGKDGSIIGELDVGQSLDMINRRQSVLTRELVIKILISTVVVTMLQLEFNFLLGYFQAKRSKEKMANTQLVPLRSMVFIIYLADAMQDAFIAILCSQLYEGGLPIPDGVAIALPMSAQLLMLAVFSIFAGRLVEQFGSRLVMSLGMAVNCAGFLLCMLLGDYFGLLIGKLLIGAGMGTVYVSCNAVAATGSSDKLIADANGAIAAGTLAGMTIGAGLSSMLLSMGSWRAIYLIGAAITGLGLLLSAFSGNVRVGLVKRETGGEGRISTWRFLTSRHVIGFFLLVLVPFMIAISYREYFFPLYGSEHGIDEVRIGQIYLLCGVLTLYGGPSLSSWMIRKLGAFWSVTATSAAMGVIMLLFVLFPSLWTVILGVVILSLVFSFSSACQYTYYELTPLIARFGEGRAVGAYSVFESLGQTVGPIAYGAILTLGYRKGIGVFCAAMLALLAAFVLLTPKRGKRAEALKGGE